MRHLRICDNGPRCASNIPATVAGHDKTDGGASSSGSTYYLKLRLSDGKQASVVVDQEAYSEAHDGDNVTAMQWHNKIVQVNIHGDKVDTTSQSEANTWALTLVALLGVLCLIGAWSAGALLKARRYVDNPPVGIVLIVHFVVGMIYATTAFFHPYFSYGLVFFIATAAFLSWKFVHEPADA